MCCGGGGGVILYRGGGVYGLYLVKNAILIVARFRTKEKSVSRFI